MRRRGLLRAGASLALTVLTSSSCHDSCFLVVGCGDSNRIAVDGQLVTTEAGQAVSGASLTLFANHGGVADSTTTTSNAQGLFSLVLPAVAAVPETLALRVLPRGQPGYTISPLDCKPIVKWGDACVLNPIVEQPSFPIFQFLYRADLSMPAANVHVTFRRTGGATLIGPKVTDPLQVTTDPSGIGLLFPPGIYAGSLQPVIGDLTVDLPPPIGTTIRHNYRIGPNPRFNARVLSVQPTGPTLEYLMTFTDSASGHALQGVEVRYQRRSGIATATDSFRQLSNSDGSTFFPLAPLAQGTVIGDFLITPPASSLTTPINGVSLNTFDADSSIVLFRWRVGATGILYPNPPSGM